MKVVVFRTPQEKETGLRIFGAQPIPTDTLFFFPNLAPGYVTTEGLHENIIVGFLNEGGYLYAVYEMRPGERRNFDALTRHIVEFSALAARRIDLFLLEDMLRRYV